MITLIDAGKKHLTKFNLMVFTEGKKALRDVGKEGKFFKLIKTSMKEKTTDNILL